MVIDLLIPFILFDSEVFFSIQFITNIMNRISLSLDALLASPYQKKLYSHPFEQRISVFMSKQKNETERQKLQKPPDPRNLILI